MLGIEQKIHFVLPYYFAGDTGVEFHSESGLGTKVLDGRPD